MNNNREEALFALALSKPAAKRAAFLDAMCDGDAAFRARLDALLAAHEQPDAALATAAPQAKATMKLEFADAPDEAVGQTLGRYKLLERVGEGGCVVVYVGEIFRRCARRRLARSASKSTAGISRHILRREHRTEAVFLKQFAESGDGALFIFPEMKVDVPLEIIAPEILVELNARTRPPTHASPYDIGKNPVILFQNERSANYFGETNKNFPLSAVPVQTARE
jgi:hypothetical protein